MSQPIKPAPKPKDKFVPPPRGEPKMPRLKSLPDTKPVKAWKLYLGSTIWKETVDHMIAEGYTHLEFPDGTRIKIFKLTYPGCVGMKLEVGAATPEQYHLVAVMEPGWVPVETHK